MSITDNLKFDDDEKKFLNEIVSLILKYDFSPKRAQCLLKELTMYSEIASRGMSSEEWELARELSKSHEQRH